MGLFTAVPFTLNSGQIVPLGLRPSTRKAGGCWVEITFCGRTAFGGIAELGGKVFSVALRSPLWPSVIPLLLKKDTGKIFLREEGV